MTPTTLAQIRRQSPWLTVLVAVLIQAATLAWTLGWPATARPAETTSEGFSLFGAYQSPDRCRQCHEPEYLAWTDTTHAKASFDPIFQTFLQKADQPGECFACHATGYDMATGQFVLAGVSCEACHGPYKPDHPQESMAIAASEELCGHCHTSTRAEWQTSRHGEVGINCIACHEVHTQETRQAVATNALCAGCHTDRTQDQVHAAHIVQGMHCVDCHLSRPANDAEGAVSGRAATGHSFAVAISTCSACHTDLTPVQP